MQLNRVECGAACLAMVLSFHGRPTSVSETRKVCLTGRGGVSAAAIVRGAEAFGLTAKGLRGDPAVFGRIALPAIAHWNDTHFVVVERWGPRGVRIIDPSLGRRRLGHEEFAESLGSAVLVMRPGPEFDPLAPREVSSSRLLFGLMLVVPGIKSTIAQILLATVLLQVLGLALPLATKIVVDRLFGGGSAADLLGLLGLGFAVTVAAQVITGALRALLLVYLQGRLDWNLLHAFARHLYRLPLRYFHERTSGDLALRLGSVGALRNLLAEQTLVATLDAVTLVIYTAVMFAVDPVLAVLMMVVLVAQVTPAVLARTRVREYVSRHLNAQVKVQDYVLQTLGGVGTIKAAGAEEHVVRALSERLLVWAGSALRHGQLMAGLGGYSGLLRNLTPLLILWVGFTRVLDGTLAAGTLLGFMWLAVAVLGPMSALVENWQAVSAAGVAMERLGDVLRAEPEPTGTALPAGVQPGDPQFELRDVWFAYDGHGTPAVKGVTATVRAGQRVAIVGRSGAGKTTLAMLLLGLYRPTSGEVLFEGAPLADHDLGAVRQRFGAVLQEAFVLRGTVRENIALAHPDASEADIREAARTAEADEEIGLLPLGYHTPLGEHGIGLSGGQIQRLAIARALAGRPHVLILDEATSHLDAVTEERIVDNLRTLSCTQIVIAHRLSTVVDADLILVMDGGRLVESGSHAALLGAGGHYARLVARQMAPDPASVGGT
jgi:ATP-binding cassette, subfamily B, bacterial